MTRLAFFAALLATPAAASAVCTDANDAMTALSDRYGEALTAIADTEAGQMVIFANPETGTFTVLIVSGPTACFAIAGEGFFLVPQQPQGEPT